MPALASVTSRRPPDAESRARRYRSRVALVLAGAAAAAAAAIVFPAPVFALWVLRTAGLEVSLLVAVAALAALALAFVDRTAVGRSRAHTVALVAVPVLVTVLIPNLAAVPAYVRSGRGFSVARYLGKGGVAARVDRDVALDPAGPLRADVYRPGAPGPHPLVVVVHGGAWRGGDKGAAPHVSAALAERGYVVLDVQYGLAPEHRFPQAIQDVKCLLGRARERARFLDVDPRKAALLGRSAGGQIALVAAYSTGDSRIPPACAVADEAVSAVVAVYAPTDLVKGHEQPVHPDVVRGPAALEGYLGGSPAEQPEAYRLASPIAWANRPVPPTLLIHGSGDRLVHVGHSRSLAEALRSAGRPVTFLEVPYAEHGFDVRPGGVGEQLAREVIMDFLETTLRR